MAPEPAIPAAHPDTVADAAATPEREMPWKELGLKADEYESIRELLDGVPRTPSWPCTRSCGPSTAPTSPPRSTCASSAPRPPPEMREHLLVGMGENAGVVDIGDGWP